MGNRGPLADCGIDALAGDGASLLATAHQRRNAAAALAALDALALATGITVAAAERAQGLHQARWPGRFETVAHAPRVILDGAHNPHGATALAHALRDVPRRRLLVVAGVSAEKDVAGVLAPVLALADRVCFTMAPNPRALSPHALVEIARTLVGDDSRFATAPDPESALAALRRDATPEDCIVVYGSLFLVGAVRCLLLGEAADPIVVQDPSGAPPAPGKGLLP
jgi:dihydrofolate synthase / folylpolyglutamate synthase